MTRNSLLANLLVACIGAGSLGLLAGQPLAAAERTAWPTASAVQQQLKLPMSVSWTGVPLSQAIRDITQTERVCVLVDRRVDPNRKLELTIDAEPLSLVLQRMAVQLGQQTAVIDSLIYFGPPAVAEQVRTLSELRHEQVRGLPPARRRLLLERRQWQWDDLATPRELLLELARQGGVKIDGGEQIPHDLWRGADLPPLGWVDRLLLLCVQFNLCFDLDSGGTTARLVPLPEHSEITRSYSGQGQPAALAAKWRSQLPAARVTAEGDQVVVVGRIEDHELLDEARHAGSATRKTVKPGKQVYQLAVEKAPLRQLLAQLGPKLNVEFEADEPAIRQAGRSLDELVSFKVHDASLDELLSAVLAPAGLTFARQEKKVKIGPAAKGP